MKKVLTLLLLAASLNCVAQKKDSAQAAKDVARSVKDTTAPAPKLFYLMMQESKWVELLAILKTADEKPSKLKEWEQGIMTSLQLYVQPKPEPAKKP